MGNIYENKEFIEELKEAIEDSKFDDINYDGNYGYTTNEKIDEDTLESNILSLVNKYFFQNK